MASNSRDNNSTEQPNNQAQNSESSNKSNQEIPVSKNESMTQTVGGISQLVRLRPARPKEFAQSRNLEIKDDEEKMNESENRMNPHFLYIKEEEEWLAKAKINLEEFTNKVKLYKDEAEKIINSKSVKK